MTTIITKKELKDVAKEILEKVSLLAVDRGGVVALSGDLGAGKTTLSQNIAEVLGVKEKIISPTFVIMKKYSCENSKWKNLIHIDAYRLKDSSELEKLGWQEILNNKENLILVEWPEQVPECIPKENICQVNISHVSEEERGIEIK